MGKFRDLSGMQFGRLTVLRRDESCKGKNIKWICQCSCGSITSVAGYHLTRGDIQSCGCLCREAASARCIDLTGNTYGRLTVVKRAGVDSGKNVTWICRCSCGNSVVVAGDKLKSGNTKSCGCLSKEVSRKTIELAHLSATKHGSARRGKRDRLYGVWHGMRARCNNPNNTHYDRYGGRGIRICQEWNDYSNFKDWAMSHGYDPEAAKGMCTIDRIDNDKGYSPDNCRFVDMKVQASNRSAGKRK